MKNWNLHPHEWFLKIKRQLLKWKKHLMLNDIWCIASAFEEKKMCDKQQPRIWLDSEDTSCASIDSRIDIKLHQILIIFDLITCKSILIFIKFQLEIQKILHTWYSSYYPTIPDIPLQSTMCVNEVVSWIQFLLLSHWNVSFLGNLMSGHQAVYPSGVLQITLTTLHGLLYPQIHVVRHSQPDGQ